MIALSPLALAAIALFLALWLCLGLWSALGGARRSAALDRWRGRSESVEAVLDAAPAIPLLVHADGRTEASQRLAGLLGLDEVPTRIEQLPVLPAGTDGQGLIEEIRGAAATAGSFRLALRAQGASRVLLVEGGPAPPPYPPATILLWFLDATENEEEIGRLRAEVAQLGSAVDALSGLIEAAPFPIWHRGPDLRLALVNSAYVAAVEAGDARSVVQQGIELVDESEGRSPQSQAEMVRARGASVARTVPATIAGERRMTRVVEVPVGSSGVAGYAIDVEDREQARADLARFVRAQRDMLDQLSAGVAQFGRDRTLTFSTSRSRACSRCAPNSLPTIPNSTGCSMRCAKTAISPKCATIPTGRKRVAAGSPQASWPKRRTGCSPAACISAW
jgi:PAS domain-containing protein